MSTDRSPVYILKVWLRGNELLGQALAYSPEVVKRFGESMVLMGDVSVIVEYRQNYQAVELTWEKFLEYYERQKAAPNQ